MCVHVCIERERKIKRKRKRERERQRQRQIQTEKERVGGRETGTSDFMPATSSANSRCRPRPQQIVMFAVLPFVPSPTSFVRQFVLLCSCISSLHNSRLVL